VPSQHTSHNLHPHRHAAPTTLHGTEASSSSSCEASPRLRDGGRWGGGGGGHGGGGGIVGVGGGGDGGGGGGGGLWG